MFDKVVGDLSGKVLSFCKMLTSQKFPTPQPDTKPLSGSALFPFSFFSFFFADSAPMGFRVTSSHSPDSIHLWQLLSGCSSSWPQSHSHLMRLRHLQGLTARNKSLFEVLPFKPRPLCFVYTCSRFCAVHRHFCFQHNLQSWINTVFTSRSMTMTLKSSKPP